MGKRATMRDVSSVVGSLRLEMAIIKTAADPSFQRCFFLPKNTPSVLVRWSAKHLPFPYVLGTFVLL